MKWAERGREREIGEEGEEEDALCCAPRCRVAKRVIAKQGQSARETNDKTAASYVEGAHHMYLKLVISAI